jgi:hypothetical protein
MATTRAPKKLPETEWVVFSEGGLLPLKAATVEQQKLHSKDPAPFWIVFRDSDGQEVARFVIAHVKGYVWKPALVRQSGDTLP